MAELVVSAATGALKPLLEKLAAALGEEYKSFKGARDEVKSLAKELEFMDAFLVKMADEENPSVQDKAWMKEVRELSYDMEDNIDEFMLRVDDKSNNPHGLVAKLKTFIDKIKARRHIAKKIQDLKIQVKEVAERKARYKTRETISKTSNTDVDSRALVIFESASKLVGLDQPKKELTEHLMTNKNNEPPKVISIVGSGGLGKTTLAYQVYQELQDKFESHAFVSVSRTRDFMKVLRNILHRVSNGPHHGIDDWDMQLLISKINDSVKEKRYLIVIDDIWTKEAWETISCALFKNHRNSKIITTTRTHDVAKACCSLDGDFIYQMKPLDSADSKKLFLERLFGSEDKCPAHLTGICNEILKKCDGLPLAIISIAGLLASKSGTEAEWRRVQNSIGRGLEKHEKAESMMQILSLSYFELPHYLKTCLLYLSVFPEDSTIKKKRLVRRWIAEGFIEKEQGQTQYELGERCFNELINRSLIQGRDINEYGEVRACQLHDTVLDFIVSKSKEENFVTVFGDGYELPGSDSKVRRLSLHASREEKASALARLDLSHVRSVTVFDYSAELPLFSKNFSFLRVLDLQGCRQVKGRHLSDIGSSFHLRYLGLRETGVREIPEQIWKLKFLETLDLKKSQVKKLPADIAQLRRLVCLSVGRGVELPDGIESLTELEDLYWVNIFKQSISFWRELWQLKNLRNVRLFLNFSSSSSVAAVEKEYLSNLASSLCKLGHLHSLTIQGDLNRDFSLDSPSSSGADAPVELRKFEITNGYISKFPNWVRFLENLRCLWLQVMEFEVEDVMALGRLPVLEFLGLRAHGSFQGRTVTIGGADGFQRLRRFDYGCAIPVTFQAGAMPEIKELTLWFSLFKTCMLAVREEDMFFRFGIQHLTGLGSVSVSCLLSEKEFRDWANEKTTQMAHMSCEQVKETTAEVAALFGCLASQLTSGHSFFLTSNQLRRQPASQQYFSLTASPTTTWQPNGLAVEQQLSSREAHTHIKSPGLEIITRSYWSTPKPYWSMTSGSGNLEEDIILRGVKRQLEERIRSCPVKGEGNCQCRQGLPSTS